MEILKNNTPKEELDNINELVLSGMSTNQEKLVEVNGYVFIAENDESSNSFNISCFTPVPYTL